jgi:molybdate-binding protein
LDYNFAFAEEELEFLPAIVNFCQREQGLLLAKGNPKTIRGVADLGQPGVKVVNRPLGTGTRLLFDRKLQEAGINVNRLDGYHKELQRHLDVGVEVFSGRADAGPGIKAVSGLLDLDFIPLKWERFDLLVNKYRFFDKEVQSFMGLLHEPSFHELVEDLKGYDTSISGKMVYPKEEQGK